MKLTKKKISMKISQTLECSALKSDDILEAFLNVLKKETKTKKIKISGFGTFNIKLTPERIGRNPLNKKTYLISKRKKLSFKPSSKIKELLN